jgi:uncharacterized protein (DUF1499 family)
MPIIALPLVLLLALTTPPAMASLFGDLFAGSPPPGLGARDGRLASCPASPNCVNSQAGDAAHAIAPFPVNGDPAAAFARLATLVAAQDGAKIVTQRGDYLHAEFRSATLGFVDDVEFLLDPATRTIAVRSASRLGYSDLGVNRKRVDRLRAAFEGAGAKS